MAIRALVFKLDDTLYPTAEYRGQLLDAAATWLEGNHGLPRDEVLAQLGTLDAQSSTRGPVVDQQPREFLAQCWEELGLGESELDELTQHLVDYEPQDLCLFGSARKFLDYVSKDFHLALIADGHGAIQRRKIRALGLLDYFDFVTCTADQGDVWASHAHLPYLAICSNFNLETRHVLAVGSHPVHSFAGPKLLDIECARVRTGFHADTPGHDTLIDVTSLLELAEQPLLIAGEIVKRRMKHHASSR